MQDDGNPRQQPRRVVAPDDVGQFVGDHRPTLGLVPLPPVARQEEHRPEPPRRGGRGQVQDLAQLDRPHASH